MNKVKRIVAPLLIALTSLSTVQTPVPTFAATQDFEYDWIVDIKTTELKDYFKYKGAAFRDISKARVSYYAGRASEKDKATPYQDLYYGGRKPLGLERYSPLDKIEYGDNVAIRIHHESLRKSASASDSMSDAEAWAAANAALRVMLDANLRKASVLVVIVPARSFRLIQDGFGQQRFLPVADGGADGAGSTQAAGAETGAVQIRMVSDSDALMSQILSYQ